MGLAPSQGWYTGSTPVRAATSENAVFPRKTAEIALTSGGIFWRDSADEDLDQVALAKRRGKSLKTKEELKALAIPKLALIERANLHDLGLNHAKRLLAGLIADGELHE